MGHPDPNEVGFSPLWCVCRGCLVLIVRFSKGYIQGSNFDCHSTANRVCVYYFLRWNTKPGANEVGCHRSDAKSLSILKSIRDPVIFLW